MIRKSTWILLAIFILMVAGVFLWQKSQDSQSEEETPNEAVEFLIDTKGILVVGLRISSPDGHSMEVRKKADGMWELIGSEDKQIDLGRIESTISSVEELRLVTKLNTELDKKIIGLDPPRYKLEVELENQDLIVALIGEETPTQGSYYAFIDSNPVVVVSSYGVENLIKLLNDPPILRPPTAPPTQ